MRAVSVRNLLALTAAVMLLCAGSAAGSTSKRQSPRPGAACASPTVSASNEYCEDIPSAAGPQTPAPGTPALGPALPARVTAAILGGSSTAGHRSHRRRDTNLLSLPAPGPREPLAGALPHVSGLSLITWLLIVLGALALATVAGAVARHRRAPAT